MADTAVPPASNPEDEAKRAEDRLKYEQLKQAREKKAQEEIARSRLEADSWKIQRRAFMAPDWVRQHGREALANRSKNPAVMLCHGILDLSERMDAILRQMDERLSRILKQVPAGDCAWQKRFETACTCISSIDAWLKLAAESLESSPIRARSMLANAAHSLQAARELLPLLWRQEFEADAGDQMEDDAPSLEYTLLKPFHLESKACSEDIEALVRAMDELAAAQPRSAPFSPYGGREEGISPQLNLRRKKEPKAKVISAPEPGMQEDDGLREIRQQAAHGLFQVREKLDMLLKKIAATGDGYDVERKLLEECLGKLNEIWNRPDGDLARRMLKAAFEAKKRLKRIKERLAAVEARGQEPGRAQPGGVQHEEFMAEIKNIYRRVWLEVQRCTTLLPVGAASPQPPPRAAQRSHQRQGSMPASPPPAPASLPASPSQSGIRDLSPRARAQGASDAASGLRPRSRSQPSLLRLPDGADTPVTVPSRATREQGGGARKAGNPVLRRTQASAVLASRPLSPRGRAGQAARAKEKQADSGGAEKTHSSES